jgi:hypothetical protein
VPLFLFEARVLIAKISLAKFFAQNFPGKLRLVFRKVELFAGPAGQELPCARQFLPLALAHRQNSPGGFFPSRDKIDV